MLSHKNEKWELKKRRNIELYSTKLYNYCKIFLGYVSKDEIIKLNCIKRFLNQFRYKVIAAGELINYLIENNLFKIIYTENKIVYVAV